MPPLALHHYERRINGRVYRVEVSQSGTQWRARVVNALGQPTSLMPFDGDTPEHAADGVLAWLQRVHRSACDVGR